LHKKLSPPEALCAKPKRWKKTLNDITNWNKFDRSHFMTDTQIDEWVATTRHKVMYRDAENVD
jgi:5,6-dimethylbenzimidazole synthase